MPGAADRNMAAVLAISDSKTEAPATAAPLASDGLVIEAVAGAAAKGHANGALDQCQFSLPTALCRYDDSLIVADLGNYTIRLVDGVLGVTEPLMTSAEFQARAERLVMAAIATLPKELARITAQYLQHSAHTLTIAGEPGASGHRDGSALTGALLECPLAVAVDTTDPVAGPQLIVSEGHHVRCLNLRTEMVTSIAGSMARGRSDGSALSEARFESLSAVVVAPNGAVFAVDGPNKCVRRLSAAKRPAERMVMTLIGEAGPDVEFASSSAASFRSRIWHPNALALHAPAAVLAPASSSGDEEAAAVVVDAECDVGRLYVSAGNELHAFDLAEGERKHFAIAGFERITGLAVSEDGARLFIVTPQSASVLDTRTGASTPLITVSAVGGFRAGPVTSDEQTSGGFSFARGCVLDESTGSLVMCEHLVHRIVRLRGFS
jgi:hypothetical protein